MGNGYNSDHYVGIDGRNWTGVDKICNFESEKLPFDDSSVDEIITIRGLKLDSINEKINSPIIYTITYNDQSITFEDDFIVSDP